MALSDVLNPKKKEAKEKTAEFVGMKLQIADANELKQKLGLPIDSGGGQIFRKMIEFILSNTAA